MIRTDLAVECCEIAGQITPQGVQNNVQKRGDLTITTVEVTDRYGAAAIGKPMGKYITVQMPPFAKNVEADDEAVSLLAEQLSGLLPDEGLVLVAGLGNYDITPDALGPKAVSQVLATRHFTGELAKQTGLDTLRGVAAIAPGVLGKTGIETSEIIGSVAEDISPCCVIVVDALASRSLERLGCTIQIADSGISPGSGVGNKRKEISRETLGVPVVSVGVPTVVDGATLAGDLLEQSQHPESESLRRRVAPHGMQMMVTPREVDVMIDRAAKVVSMAINQALQPTLSREDITYLVS